MGKTLHVVISDKGILYSGEDYEKFEETVKTNQGEKGLTTYFLDRRHDYVSITRHILNQNRLGVEGRVSDISGVSIINEGLIQILKGFL
jgi:hypothetical protein